MLRTIFYTFIIILILIPVNIYAQIYTYRDSKGVIHFSNIPVSRSYKTYRSPKKYNRYYRGKKRRYSSKKYDSLIKRASRIHGISSPLIKSMIKVESNFNPYAVSRTGAKGLMQIMPSNYRDLRIRNPFDPWQNIHGGTLFLKRLLQKYNGRLSLSLAAYNAGPGAVDRYRGIPPYKETQNYVKQVIKNYKKYKRSL